MKITTLVTIFLAAACGGSNNSLNFASKEAAPMEIAEDSFEDVSRNAQATSTNESTPTEFEQKLIKTGNLSYQAKDAKEEYIRVINLLSSFQAYLSSENQNKGYDRINYNLSIKVPPQYFDSLIITLSEGKKIDNKQINVNDVTDQYYDLKSRIDNKKKLEERYQEILKKASSIKDILEIERSLNTVRTEIESLEGQFKLLRHQIRLSTLNLHFYEVLPYTVEGEQRPGFGIRLLNAVSWGWNGFLSFIVVLVRLWPFVLLTFLVVIVVKRARSSKASSK